MVQHVEEPTQISGNVLDLIISNDANLIQEVRMEGRLASSNHERIEAEVMLEAETSHGDQRDYSKGKYQEMRRCLANVSWEEELEERRVEESWSFIKQLLLEMTEKYVPLKRKRSTR